MAYTDFEFYKNTYLGNVVPESEFNRIEARASDYIDMFTFERLANGLPMNERSQTKVKKAVCAVCDVLYQIDLAQRNAIAAAKKAQNEGNSCEHSTGIITAKSSGSESISYASLSEVANSAKTWSAVYQAAGDEHATNKLLYDTAKVYLTGVRDDEGTPLLYAGL